MSQATFNQQQKEAQQQEAEFRAKYQDPNTGKLINVPVQGRFDAPLVERLQYAISNDPRSRFNGESHGQVTARRKAVLEEEAQKEQSNKAGSSQLYEQKVFNQMETMGLGREYRAGVSHWAMREENEE